MNKISKKNREKKEQIVKELAEKVSRAHGVVLTNYQGLTHKQLEGLKKELRPLDAEFAVTKNTLLKIALQQTRHSGEARSADSRISPEGDAGQASMTIDAAFQQPTGTLFAYGDVVSPLKALAKMIKDLKLPTIKFGIVEGQALDGEAVLKLSTLPPRETLIAQFVGGMKSPLYGIHRALNWNIQKFVMTLNAIGKTKENINILRTK